MANGLKHPHEGRLPDLPSRQGLARRRAEEEAVSTSTQAWQTIAHPDPQGRSRDVEPTPPDCRRQDRQRPHKFTGVMACAACHTGPKFNFQFSQWRLSKHARAYAVLATPQRLRNRPAKPASRATRRSADQCLKCHATGADFDRGQPAQGLRLTDGVQCESCHGPGSDYSPEAVMLDKATARSKGLLEVERQDLRALPRKGPRQAVRLRHGGEADRASHQAAADRRAPNRPTRIRSTWPSRPTARSSGSPAKPRPRSSSWTPPRGQKLPGDPRGRPAQRRGLHARRQEGLRLQPAR